MAAESEVALRLALKNRHETVAGLDDVGDELNRVGDQADRAGRKARGGAAGLAMFGKAGRLAGRAVAYGVGAAAVGVVAAGVALVKVSKDSIGEAREAQKVGAITRREIKATGGAANVTARQVGRLTGAISRKVGIDDEAIQSGANLLLTFKNVRNEVGAGNRVFDQATKAAVDLSAAGFGSIESGSKMLGKALNDPIKGISAMSRAGVTFTQQQQDQIAAMVEQNNLLGAQKIILGEVKSQVGGVAAAQATWGEKARVTFGNIEERFGTALLPLLDDVERWFVREGGPALDHWVGIFEKRGIPVIEHYADLFQKKAVPAIGDFLDDAKPLAKSILPAIGSGLGTAADAFKIIAPRAKAVFDAFNDLPDWAKSAIAIGAGAGIAAKKLGATSLLTGGTSGVLGAVTKSKPLPVWVVNSKGLPDGDTPVWANPKYAKVGKVVAIAGQAGLLAFMAYEDYKFATDTMPNNVRNMGTTPGHVGIRPSGGDFQPDAYGTAIQNGVVSGKTAGDKVGVAAAEKDWLKVIRLVHEYRSSLDDSTYSQGVLSTTSQAFARRFGVSLADLDRIMGGRIPKSMDQVKAAIGRADGEQRQLTRSILGGKAASDELTRQLGVIAKDWHAKLYLDGYGTAMARLDSYASKLASIPGMESAAMSPPHKAAGGPVEAGRPYVVGEHRPELFVPKVDGRILPSIPPTPRFDADWDMAPASDPVHVHVHVDGREMATVVLDRIRDIGARA